MELIPQYSKLATTFTHLPVARQCKVNIGDAIQTVAARELWNVQQFCERNRPGTWTDDMVVPMHGWYSDFIYPTEARVYLLGFHLSYGARIKLLQERHIRDWLIRVVKDQGFPALARDTSTRDFLRSVHVPAEFAGCISETLPKYDGPRAGVINTDKRWTEDGIVLYQSYVSWDAPTYEDLIRQGEQRLDELRQASEVWTARLHVMLPCRAMGTPVQARGIMDTHEAHRFSGLVYDIEPRAYDLKMPEAAIDSEAG